MKKNTLSRIIEGSLSAADIIVVPPSNRTSTSEMDDFRKQFAQLDKNGEIDEEYHRIMQGTAIYVPNKK